MHLEHVGLARPEADVVPRTPVVRLAGQPVDDVVPLREAELTGDDADAVVDGKRVEVDDDEDDVIAAVNRAVDEFGALDVVYANAGISGAATGYRPFFDLQPEDWEVILRVNLIGPFLAIKHAAPIMAKAGKGSIICTASVAAAIALSAANTLA